MVDAKLADAAVLRFCLVKSMRRCRTSSTSVADLCAIIVVISIAGNVSVGSESAVI